MKLSIVTFALFATGVASAADKKSLRSSNTNNGKSVVESSDMQASIILGGVQGQPTKADLDIIGKAFVSSYNDAHWEADHAMLGNHATESVGWTCRCKFLFVFVDFFHLVFAFEFSFLSSHLFTDFYLRSS
jgi:hypothetical protein